MSPIASRIPSLTRYLTLTILPASHRALCLVSVTTAIVFSALSATSYAQMPGVQSTVNQEIARRSINENYASQVIAKGQIALQNKDYESAFAYFRSAADTLTDSPAFVQQRQQALRGFSEATLKLAEQRISEGRFADAESTVKVLLEDRYLPNNSQALALLDKLRSPDYFNKTLSPQFIGKVEEVKQLLLEADGFYRSGRFDASFARYQQVLNIDPYNIAARVGMERISNQKAKYYEAAHNESRSRMIEQVDSNWALPVPKYDVGAATIIDQPKINVRATENIQRKLDNIIIPGISFKDATIREALDFLKQSAAKLDVTEPDPTKKGINIFLKLDPTMMASDSGPRITVDLNNIPLNAALKYVTDAANLKMKIEPHAVAIVPLSEPTDLLLTKEYTVSSTFTNNIKAPATDGGLGMPGGAAVAAQSGVRDYLMEQGVTFPQGASANLLANRGRLIVKNTQDNLDLIDLLLLGEGSENKFTQVEIETKFVEINQNNMQELSFDWLLGQFALLGGTGIYGGGGTTGNQRGYHSSDYPLLNQSGQAIGLNPANNAGQITAGNRSGGTAIKANAIDAILYGGPTGPAAGILSLAGVFTNPQFQVVIRALNQMKGADLMSAPKVIARNAVQANIRIAREFIYPTEFQPPQLPTSTGSQLTPITPTTPTAFTMRPLGVELTVLPNVGTDLATISLELTPSVTEFDGFINYGSPINIIAATGIAIPTINGNGTVILLGPSSNMLASENVVNQPVFSVRKITTNVTILDGQTVALGGLINENIQKVEDKTPILGDVPFVGRLFRSSVNQHNKKNLMIFVTATIIDRAGQPMVKEADTFDSFHEPSTLQVAHGSASGEPFAEPATLPAH